MKRTWWWGLLALVLAVGTGTSYFVTRTAHSLSWYRSPITLAIFTILLTGIALYYIFGILEGVVWLYAAITDRGSHERTVMCNAVPHIVSVLIASALTAMVSWLLYICRDTVRDFILKFRDFILTVLEWAVLIAVVAIGYRFYRITLRVLFGVKQKSRSETLQKSV